MPSCSSFLCPGRDGVFPCTKCQAAEPPTLYCSPECQNDDWKFHKLFCGKQAYIFNVELLNSTNPTITRMVVVPAWFTFQQFHFTLQYIFGWQNCHLHNFDFLKKVTTGDQMWPGPQPDYLLRISQPEDVGTHGPSQDERKVNLGDVYEPSGALRSTVIVNNAVAPLVYTYDFGDNWDHKITFQGSELARAARPLVRGAVGCGPVEDSGGVYGWNDVKDAFAAANPTLEQQERIAWAKARSGLGDSYDPLAPIDITAINSEERWGNHYKDYMQEERQRVY